MSDLFLTLSFEPDVEHFAETSKQFVLGGMGGSAVAAAAAGYVTGGSLAVHESYGLPDDAPTDALYIAVSYSGETAETLSFAREALERGLSLGVVTGGGELLKLAQEHNLPTASVPPRMVPRDAAMAMMKAVLALEGSEAAKGLPQAAPDATLLERDAREVADFLEGKIPVIYSTPDQALLGRILKMYCNESAKIPAFTSVMPARGHDEVQGFTPDGPHGKLAELMAPIVIRREGTDEHLTRHLDALVSLSSELGLATHTITLPADSLVHALVYGWALSRRATEIFAEAHDLDPAATPLTAAFKKLL